MKNSIIFSCMTAATVAVALGVGSCLPLRRPGRRGIVVLPSPGHGPARVPKPKVARPPRPFAGAVWVEPVTHWNGKQWVVKKNGYWVKPKNAPRGKAKGHHKKK